MKNKSEKWRQSGRWFLGRGWNRARPNSAKRSRKFCRNVSRKIHCAARLLKMTAMKNDSPKNHYGKSEGFILCVFRTGLPGNSAKVGAVGKIQIVQWAAQAEPEFPLECPLQT